MAQFPSFELKTTQATDENDARAMFRLYYPPHALIALATPFTPDAVPLLALFANWSGRPADAIAFRLLEEVMRFLGGMLHRHPVNRKKALSSRRQDTKVRR
jgi:hypothetical protein